MEHVEQALSERGYNVNLDSLREEDGVFAVVVEKNGGKYIAVNVSKLNGDLTDIEDRISIGDKVVSIAGWTWDNYLMLRNILHLNPKPCNKKASFGTGDRLGLATSFHLSALSKYNIFPVTAQQSPRELQKTSRDFKDVMLKAVLGALESGYAGNFGADADHIKDEAHLQSAIEAGFTMYTLDVSDELQSVESRDVGDLSGISKDIIERYADCQGEYMGVSYRLTEAGLCESALIYEKSMQKVKDWYCMIRSQVPEIDLEVSIDEGVRTTTPEDHLYCAEFLLQTGVEFTSLAPKFPGEFQKGIDFIGDISAFKNDLFIHAGIADRIGGYRLSLHSGSDKFSIYPIWAEATKGNYHVKTSGTSWLQAVKLICRTDLPLYQTLYKTCLDELTESKKAYHVFIEHSDFPAKLPSDIEAFCDNNNVRQLFHISYGALLYAHRSEIYECLRRNDAQHKALVEEHIQKHLTLLFPDK